MRGSMLGQRIAVKGSCIRPACLVCGTAIVMTVAAPVRAQDLEKREVPHAAKPPPNDPRRGPRLVYARGPAACLPESAFRDEVAIDLDGVDHFDATSPDVVDVKFEKIPGGFRSTLVYTDAAGKPASPTVKTYWNCEQLGR